MFQNEITFWMSPDLWPRDTKEAVFLASAYNTLGQRRFADKWIFGPPPGSPPPKIWRNYSDVEGSDDPKLYPEKAAARLERQKTFREAATNILPQFVHHALAASKLQSEVKGMIVAGLVEGSIKSVLRPVVGGEFSEELAASVWNTEDLDGRFATCQLNAADPFGSSRAGGHWIYISRPSLQRAYANSPESGSTSAAGRSAFKQWLLQEIDASPQRRTLTKESVLREGVEKYHLSKRDAGKCRDEVLRSLPQDVQNIWQKPGPTT